MLVTGKSVTGFNKIEEDFADNAVWELGLLVTGRQNFSGTETAKAVVEALGN